MASFASLIAILALTSTAALAQISPYGASPYGLNPFSSYGSPYGMSPFYGASGLSPYGANPAFGGLYGNPALGGFGSVNPMFGGYFPGVMPQQSGSSSNAQASSSSGNNQFGK